MMDDERFQTYIYPKLYNRKMNILLKLVVITLASMLLVLLFFDYDSAEVELSLSAKVNCINLNPKNNLSLCNTCFKVNPKQQVNENVRIQSTQPFLLVSLKTQISGMLTCEEWLQAIDYQSFQQSQSGDQPSLRFEVSVAKFIKTLQNEHNQILLTQKPHSTSLSKSQSYKAVSSLTRPYQIVSFYSTSRDPSSQMRVFQSNETIKSIGIHILTLLSIAGAIAVIYVFHCVQKKGALNKYNEYVFSVMGIFGTLIWIVMGNLVEQYSIYLTFCKVLFFSMAFDIIFGAGRWLFFGIILIINFSVISFSLRSSDMRTLVAEIFLLVIIAGKMIFEVRKKYYYLQKNSNKKVYLLMMAFLIVGFSFIQHIRDYELIGQISEFLVGYLSMITLLLGTKNLDGDDYQKLLKQQQESTKNQSNQSHESLPTTTMYEQSQQLQENQLQRMSR